LEALEIALRINMPSYFYTHVALAAAQIRLNDHAEHVARLVDGAEDSQGGLCVCGTFHVNANKVVMLFGALAEGAEMFESQLFVNRHAQLRELDRDVGAQALGGQPVEDAEIDLARFGRSGGIVNALAEAVERYFKTFRGNGANRFDRILQ
jgi:hypothetical protein